MHPVIAICLAAYKPDPRHLATQLTSIQKQTFRDWECIITADSEIALPAGIQEDPRFHLFLNETRKGAVKNFEEAARLALQLQPTYISFSDQDDNWHPQKLEKSLAALRRHPPLSALHTDMRIIDDQGNLIADSAWTFERRGIHNSSVTALLIRNIVAGCATLIDRQLVERFLEIPAAVPMHDQWYPILAARHGGMYPLWESLYDYRIHGKNVAGVTEFSGLMQPPSMPGQDANLPAWKRWLKVALERYQETRAKASGLHLYGQLRRGEKFVFLSPWDLGLFFLIYGACKFKRDPLLARAAWARFLGKNLFFLQKTFAAPHKPSSARTPP